jgi:hypothetical protein
MGQPAAVPICSRQIGHSNGSQGVTIQLKSMKKMLDRVLLHFFCFHL